MTQVLAMIALPCVDLCRLDSRTGICTGCFRMAEEIRRWRKLTDRQRRRVLEGAKRRRARLGKAVCETGAASKRSSIADHPRWYARG